MDPSTHKWKISAVRARDRSDSDTNSRRRPGLNISVMTNKFYILGEVADDNRPPVENSPVDDNSPPVDNSPTEEEQQKSKKKKRKRRNRRKRKTATRKESV